MTTIQPECEPRTITQDILQELLDYDPDTGDFTWLVRALEHFGHERAQKAWNNRYGGKRAGSVSSDYVLIEIKGKSFTAQHLAWLYVTGEWPTASIDHINLDKKDNRFCNLRIATSSDNACNINKRSNNTSGFKGVGWSKKAKKWYAEVRKDGKKHFLGTFKTPDEAHAAYVAAATKLHGEFARFE